MSATPAPSYKKSAAAHETALLKKLQAGDRNAFIEYMSSPSIGDADKRFAFFHMYEKTLEFLKDHLDWEGGDDMSDDDEGNSFIDDDCTEYQQSQDTEVCDVPVDNLE